MSITDVYERAMERHDLEKTAEAYIDAYGTADGYLPAPYFAAYIEMEKEAHVEMLIDTFAPETGYIPAQYISALEKEAFAPVVANVVKTTAPKAGGNFFTAMKNTARGMMAKTNPNATMQLGDVGTKTTRKVLTDRATLGDMGRFYGSKALGAMANNPTATMAGAGLVGAGGIGYAATRKRNN